MYVYMCVCSYICTCQCTCKYRFEYMCIDTCTLAIETCPQVRTVSFFVACI